MNATTVELGQASRVLKQGRETGGIRTHAATALEI